MKTHNVQSVPMQRLWNDMGNLTFHSNRQFISTFLHVTMPAHFTPTDQNRMHRVTNNNNAVQNVTSLQGDLVDRVFQHLQHAKQRVVGVIHRDKQRACLHTQTRIGLDTCAGRHVHTV